MRRVQRDATKEEFVQQLCDGRTGMFGEIWRLLLFAAVLGKADKRREPLAQVDTGKSIDPQVFANSPAWPGIFHLFGLIDGRDSSRLRQEAWEDSLAAFEEYANRGLTLLRERLADQPEYVSLLLDLLLSNRPDDGSRESITGIRL